MKEYTDISKNSIFVTMKTVLFFLPIGIITNNIYIWKYGLYSFSWNIEEILNNLFTNRPLFAFLVFCIISIVAYTIETFIFPDILIFSKSNEKTDYERSKKWFAKFSIAKYNVNIFDLLVNTEKYKDKPVILILIKELMTIPTILILWLIAFNTIISYISAVIIIILVYILFKNQIQFLRSYGIK